MEFSAKQIADFIGGRVEGDDNAKVNTFAKIEEGVPGAISFLSNPKYTHFIYETKSSIVLINEDMKLEQPVETTLIRVANAYEAVAKLLQLYESTKPKKKGIDPMASIAPSAQVADDVYIGAFAVVGEGAIVAAGSLVLSNTIIPPGTVWAGVPAKFIKRVDPAQSKELNEKIAHNYLMYSSWYNE